MGKYCLLFSFPPQQEFSYIQSELGANTIHLVFSAIDGAELLTRKEGWDLLLVVMLPSEQEVFISSEYLSLCSIQCVVYLEEDESGVWKPVG